MSSYKKVVVGTDGSTTAMLAVDRAGAVAASSDAELLIVTAFSPAPRGAVKEAQDALGDDAYQVVGSAPAEAVLRESQSRVRALGVEAVQTFAVQGEPVDALDKIVADSGADLLVVGNVGLNTLTGRILGSVPQKVARRAGVDVLIVHTS